MTFCRPGIYVLLAAALVSSADTPSTLPSVPHAKQLYYQGIYGDKNASAQADKVFTALRKANPSDPLVSVYYGSLRLLERPLVQGNLPRHQDGRRAWLAVPTGETKPVFNS